MNGPATVRVQLSQTRVLPGRPRENCAQILSALDGARRDGAEIAVFPEMAIPGYLIGDEWERAAFLRECEACGDRIRAASGGMVVVFGNVAVDWTRRNEDGRVRKYNAVFVADNGRFAGPPGTPYDFAIKTLMPNYREFDDSRHFFDLRKLALEEHRTVEDLTRPVPTRRLSLGCVACEDLWDTDYAVSPLQLLSAHDVDLFIAISASPFTANKDHKRARLLAAQVEKLQRPLVYVNNVGIQNNGKTVFTFDGCSRVLAGPDRQVSCGEPFEEARVVCDVPLAPGVPFGKPVEVADDGTDAILRAIDYGTRRFMELCGAERVVVGVSGGIDSALAACLYRRILPRDALLLVNMPGPFTSPTTRALAQELARNLDCTIADVPIDESVRLTRKQLEGISIGNADEAHPGLEVSGHVIENIQARDRSARVLAGVAAAFGGVFTCNANKSEVTVGYTTLYGDLAGYFANIADLGKTDLYSLARHCNAPVFGREVIPGGILELRPSAELSDAQNVDEGKGDPLIYPYHDRLFASWVERWNRATPEDVLEWYSDGALEKEIGYDGCVSELFHDPQSFVADLERWWALYQGMGVAKRIQAPPVLAVKRRAFGFDHRESQMRPAMTQRYEELKAELLRGGVSPSQSCS